MKGHVKLTTAEHRAWRVNKAQWVSPQGVVLRAVTPEEEQALFPLVERTKRTGRTETFTGRVVYKVRTPNGQIGEHVQSMEVTVRATKTGREAQSFLLDVFVNGNRYVKGREIIEKRMLSRHGECILFQPNGKRLRVIRNPKLTRPTYAESQRSAPHPDHCPCRAFSDRREPGRHHIACEWNGKAPPHEQATPFLREVPQTLVDSPEPLDTLAFDGAGAGPRLGYNPTVMPTERLAPPPPPPGEAWPEAPSPLPELSMRSQLPAARSAAAREPLAPHLANQHPTLEAATYTTNPPLPAQVTHRTVPDPRQGELEVYSPEECPSDCRGARNAEAAWAWPPGRRPERGHHHPLCPHEHAHRMALSSGQRWVLFDMDRRVEVRDATRDEIARSEVELQRSGARSVVIAGRIYAVVAAPPNRPARTVVAATARAPSAGHETARQQALADSGLPLVPGEAPAALYPPTAAPREDGESELSRLRARIAQLEHQATLAQPVGPGVVLPQPAPEYLRAPHPELHYPAAQRAQPYPQQPYPQQPLFIQPGMAQLTGMEVRPIATPADHLRNPQGLVGHQQLGDDIPLGTVELVEPEPFVDPIPAMRVAPPSAPAPYHPGLVHSGEFVPPAVPGAVSELEDPGPDDESDEGDVDESEPDEESPIAAGVPPLVAASATGFDATYAAP